MELTPELLGYLKEGGSFGLIALVLWYFMARYEKLFNQLNSTFTKIAVRLALIEKKLEIDNALERQLEEDK
jgi:hypothetical protein